MKNLSEALSFRAVAEGFSQRHLQCVDSTNAEALERAQDRLWVTADEQRAGRGRRGRGWHSPKGNLHASLLLLNPAPLPKVPQLCFVAAVALADAITIVAPNAGKSLKLKWPNDLLVGDAKVAGILIEGSTGVSGFQAVIGCGVNVARHPGGTPYPSSHLCLTDARITPAMLFEALSDAFASRLRGWSRGAGFAAIREAWLGKALGLGQPIVARLPERQIAGVFEALDMDGALILRDDTSTCHTLSAGEIFFAAPHSVSRVE